VNDFQAHLRDAQQRPTSSMSCKILMLGHRRQSSTLLSKQAPEHVCREGVVEEVSDGYGVRLLNGIDALHPTGQDSKGAKPATASGATTLSNSS